MLLLLLPPPPPLLHMLLLSIGGMYRSVVLGDDTHINGAGINNISNNFSTNAVVIIIGIIISKSIVLI